MSLIRYPGSKRKLAPRIIGAFPDSLQLPLWMETKEWEYREPFFGSGAIGFEVLRNLPLGSRIWLNDIDFGLVGLWQSVWRTPGELCERIERFTPSVAAYEEYKEDMVSGRVKGFDPLKAGFRKLALHQMSFSGLGPMSGGPLGGKQQDGDKYTVDCRWSPVSLISQVGDLHDVLAKHQVRLTWRDFGEMFQQDGGNVFYYCDPPYYEKGTELYQFAFKDSDHRRLRGLLRQSAGQWMVSYDDHPFIRDLYAGCDFAELAVCYTTAVECGTRPKNGELLYSRCAA